MIRRDDGDDWLILSQMEHARVAAELARVWCFGSSSTVGATDLLLSAVHDHDEGWRAWELAMQIDPKSGTPRQFTEMPMEVATEIWTKSIEFCAQKHPLPGLWVSSHFVYLGEQSLESREADLSDVSAVQRFLTAQSRFQEQCRLEALQDVTEREFDALSRFGFTFLRMFDSLSLWLCCAQPHTALGISLSESSGEINPNSRRSNPH